MTPVVKDSVWERWEHVWQRPLCGLMPAPSLAGLRHINLNQIAAVALGSWALGCARCCWCVGYCLFQCYPAVLYSMPDQGLALSDHHSDGAIANLMRYPEAPLSCRGQDTGLPRKLQNTQYSPQCSLRAAQYTRPVVRACIKILVQ